MEVIHRLADNIYKSDENPYRKLRISRGLSRKKLSDKIGLSPGTIVKLENGTTKNPEKSTLDKYMEFFECEYDFLKLRSFEPNETRADMLQRQKEERLEYLELQKLSNIQSAMNIINNYSRYHVVDRPDKNGTMRYLINEKSKTTAWRDTDTFGFETSEELNSEGISTPPKMTWEGWILTEEQLLSFYDLVTNSINNQLDFVCHLKTKKSMNYDFKPVLR